MFRLQPCLHIVLCLFILIQRKNPVGMGAYNVALNKPSKQIDVKFGAEPYKAVDGNRDDMFESGSCIHTVSTNHTWWMVDLLANYRIISVVITNRLLHSHRLSDFLVYVSDVEPQSIPDSNGHLVGQLCFRYPGTLPPSGPHTILCDKCVRGRYVYLYKPASSELVLCEIEIMTPTMSKYLGATAGRKINGLIPFYSTTLNVPSMLKCATMCLSKVCGATVLQFEASTRKCVCFDDKSVGSGMHFDTDDGWVVVKVRD